jgi:hypothetical protein
VIAPGTSWFAPTEISTPSRGPGAAPELPVMHADIVGRRDLVRRAERRFAIALMAAFSDGHACMRDPRSA